MTAARPATTSTSTTRPPDTPARFPAGTPWNKVPDDWCCPDCGVREKIDFEPEENE
ncbi:rubredoxin [Streptomyces brasiliensis]|uniref:Rubredoxin-like domain-containing protein n=1 Tax=Streptomyces brasiliensis TaxID=1954 RepID=A0A917NT20_9ACTN|nr:hypothetical protein GCM10010121_042700 [Streptomyces brasiliensis]